MPPNRVKKKPLSDEQERKIFEAYWMIKTTHEAADFAGVSQATVVNMWRPDVLKTYYRNNPLPAESFINTICELYRRPAAAGISTERKAYAKIIRKNKLEKKRMNQRLEIFEELVSYKKSIESATKS